MVSRAQFRLALLRMALSRDPEAEVNALIERWWTVAISLVGEEQLRRLLEDDRAILAEGN